MKKVRIQKVDLHSDGTHPTQTYYFTHTVPKTSIAQSFPHCLVTEITLDVYETVGEVQAISNQAVRDAALAKLTAAERAALGL